MSTHTHDGVVTSKSYITLAGDQIGYLILEDQVYMAKIIGVEIIDWDGTDNEEDRLVVLVQDNEQTHVRRCETIFNKERDASKALERILAYRSKVAA